MNFDFLLNSVQRSKWLKNRNYIFDVQSDNADTLILTKIDGFSKLNELYDARV